MRGGTKCIVYDRQVSSPWRGKDICSDEYLRDLVSCGSVRAHSPFKIESCAVCAGHHQSLLRHAGCQHSDILAYCASLFRLPADLVRGTERQSVHATPAGVSMTSGNSTCKVGDSVLCPGVAVGGPQCAGNSCCAGGVTCPSAEPGYQCCPKPKVTDCLRPSH